MYTNLPTSQAYIFRILQHFATKLCSFSNFDNFFEFFPEISFVIPRLKIFLKRKSSIAATILILYPVLTDLIIDWIELSHVSSRKLKPVSELVT